MARRWKVLSLVSVGVFMVSLDLFIVNIAFPDIAAEFHGSSVAAVSWVLNAYAIVLAALMVSAGRLADRHGRRRLFLIGLLVFVAGSGLCGAAPSLATLVLARAVQALGAALLLPTSLGLLLPEFPPAERAAAIGVWAAIGGLAAAAGPPLGGLLVQASWRLVFLVNLPVGLAAFAYGVRLLRESRDEDAQRADLLGSLLIIGGVGLLALALVKAPDWGWGSPRTLATFAAAAAGLGAFAWRCVTHEAPVIEPAIVRVRSFAAANLASVLFSAAFAAMLLANVLFMTLVWRESVLVAGISLAPGPAMAAAVAVPTGRIANRFGQRLLAAAGLALFALACLWWRVRVGAAPAYAAQMLPGLLVSGAGVGLVLPTLASASAASLPPARFATGSAVYAMARQVGFVLGVSVLVAVLGTVTPGDALVAFDRGWTFMVIASVCAGAVAVTIGRIDPQAAAAAAPSTGPAPRGVAEELAV